MPAELATSLTSTEAERLEQAEALVRSFCGWHIAPSRTETVVLPGSFNWTLLLPSMHVTAVTAVTSDTDAPLATTDFDWSDAGVLTGRTYPWTGRTVAVEFTHGYATPPAEVTAVVQAVAQRAVQNPGSLIRSQSGPFADTYSQTGANQSLPIALLDAEKDVLRRYRIPSVG